MNTKIIILSGAPSAGKDTLADHLCSSAPDIFTKQQFKTHLNKLVKAIYHVSDDEWNRITTYNIKNDPQDILFGKSSRQAQIYVSEVVIKPAFGKDYFGQSALKYIEEGKINVFSDGGFPDEIEVFINKYGPENIMILRIHRLGADYSFDSRRMLFDDRVESCDITNNNSIPEFLTSAEEVIHASVLINGFDKYKKL